MYSINIKNKITGKVWGQGTFYTGDDLNNYREQEKNFIFGKPERWVKENERESYEISLTPLDISEQDGVKVYHYESDYTFEVSLSSNELSDTLALGQRYRKCCEEAHNYITGYNAKNNIDASVMQAEYGTIFQLILANRPKSLKTALLSIDTSGVSSVAKEMKDTLLVILRKYGF